MVKSTKEKNGIHPINVCVKCASVPSTATQALQDKLLQLTAHYLSMQGGTLGIITTQKCEFPEFCCLQP